MNKERRKELEKARGHLEEAKAIISDAASEERDYYDNMSENLQGGEKGEKAGTDADNLEAAEQTLDEIISQLNEAIE